MSIHSLYFLIYAVLATIVVVFMAWGYISQNRKNGAPINYTLLEAVFAVAIAMWTGVAATEAVYNTNVVNIAITLFLALVWTGTGILLLVTRLTGGHGKTA